MKKIYAIVEDHNKSEFQNYLTEFQISALPTDEAVLPPAEILTGWLDEPTRVFHLVDEKTGQSNRLLEEIYTYNEINDVRILCTVGMQHGLVLLFSSDSQKPSWIDGEDFITFVEHSDEFRKFATGAKGVFFKIPAFGKAPGWMPNVDILQLIDES